MRRLWAWATAATAVWAGCVAGTGWLLARSYSSGDLVYNLVLFVLALVPLSLGWLLLRHDRSKGDDGGAVVGAHLAWMGVVPVLGGVTDTYGRVVARVPGSLPVVGWVVATLPVIWIWYFIVPSLLALRFPNGRLLSPRWKVVSRGLLALAAVIILLSAVSPDPYPPAFSTADRMPWTLPPGLVPAFRVVATAALFALLGGLIASAASIGLRRRRSSDAGVRAQLRWFSLAGLGIPVTLLLCWLSYAVLGRPDLVFIGIALTWVALPTATWVAITRNDLYEVDRVAAAAVSWMVVMTLFLVGYTAVAVGGSVLLGIRSPVLAATTAVGLGLLALPARGWVGRRVDRWLYPARARARDAVRQLTAQVREGSAQPEMLEEVLRTALREPGLVVSHLVPGTPSPMSAVGEPVVEVGSGPRVPLRRHGTAVGEVSGLGESGARIVRELEDQVVQLVEFTRLRLELNEALRETAESRRRVQSAGYLERRRLERDLHDGAQQRLVALGMRLRVVQRHLSEEEAELRDVLDTSVAELGTAVSELRQIAHGIRPSCLDDGLGAALAPLARSGPVSVTVTVSTGDLPDEVSTTIYYVVMEAVTNAIKHSAATRIDVSVEQAADLVTLKVIDDGHGGADRAGSGWSGVADRVAAAGGTLNLASPPDAGTELTVVLQCA